MTQNQDQEHLEEALMFGGILFLVMLFGLYIGMSYILPNPIICGTEIKTSPMALPCLK